MVKLKTAIAFVVITILVGLLVLVLLPVGRESSLLSFQEAARDRVKHVRTFAVYYGMISEREEEILKRFDMVIIQDYAVEGGTVLQRLSGTLKIGYLNLAKYAGRSYGNCRLTDWQSIAIEYDPDWKLYIMDTRTEAWRKFILCSADELFKMGFDGILFDDVDVAEIHAELKESIAGIIEELRRRYPDKILGTNRGFELLGLVHSYLDFVLAEDLGTMYDFSIGDYRKLTQSELRQLLHQVNEAKQLGLQVLALAYSREPCDELDLHARKLAADLGVPIYTSDWQLSELRAPYECQK